MNFKLKAASDEEVIEQYSTMKSIPYHSAVGSLMYSMIGTRPDLYYAVGLMCRYMTKPIKEHWQAFKWILRYISGTLKRKLCFRNDGEFIIRGYCDSDYAADQDKRRSISGMVFTVGGNPVTWRSCLQRVVALSTTEAKYMTMTEASKEDVWIKGLMGELGFQHETIEVFYDSQSAIALAKNAFHHERMKHIAVKLHFIRDLISDGVLRVMKIATAYNPADIFTKVLPVSEFQYALELLRISEK